MSEPWIFTAQDIADLNAAGAGRGIPTRLPEDGRAYAAPLTPEQATELADFLELAWIYGWDADYAWRTRLYELSVRLDEFAEGDGVVAHGKGGQGR